MVLALVELCFAWSLVCEDKHETKEATKTFRQASKEKRTLDVFAIIYMS